MSQAPQQEKDIKALNMNGTRTTELTLKSRMQNNEEIHHRHIQVSHEFLGGRFDIKG